MKKTLMIPLSALVVLSLVATVALAAQGKGPGPKQGPNPAMAWQQLSPEQQQKADELFEAHQEKVRPIHDKIYAKEMTLQAMVNGGQADEKAITKLVTDISDLRQQLREEGKSFHDELTKATGIEFFGRGFGGMGRGFGPGQGMGPCGGGFGPGQGMGPGQGFGPCGGGFGPGAPAPEGE